MAELDLARHWRSHRIGHSSPLSARPSPAKFQASSILNALSLEYLIHHSASFGRPGAGPAIALSFILVPSPAARIGVLCRACRHDFPSPQRLHLHLRHYGRTIAWIIGWDLILEYAVSNMAVSVWFFAAYGQLIGLVRRESESSLDFAGLPPTDLPTCREHALRRGLAFIGFNWPAFIIVML